MPNPTPLSATLDNLIDGDRYWVEFESNLFARGTFRYAFKGVYVGNGRKNGTQCVTKIFIDEAARQCKNNYLPDLAASRKANEFAQAFNAQFPSTKPLRFIEPEMATVDELVDNPGGDFCKFVKPRDRILVEDFIDGSYQKFNSNGGWQSDDVAAIPAFSHYTFWKSDGQFLVCDIQGVRTPTGYILTDPAVLSRQQGQFGLTDTGPSGMTTFFRSHRCTSVCSRFPKPKYNYSRRINSGRRNRKQSTYTFMLGDKEREANEYFNERNDLPAIDEERPDSLFWWIIGGIAAGGIVLAYWL